MASQLASANTASPAGALQSDVWLSEVCRRKTHRVGWSADRLVEPPSAERLIAAFNETQPDFVFAKVDTQRVDAASVLARMGFTTVDVNLTLSTPPKLACKYAEIRDVSVAEVERGRVVDVSRHPLPSMAAECFRFSRFHLDPEFPDDVADRIKFEWIANYLRGDRGDKLWEARVDGVAAGFLAALAPVESDFAVIDLIGVAESFQGRGVGRALIRAFLEHYTPRKQRCLVGTQAANAPSLRLYQKMGFQFESSAFVLHWHSITREDHENRTI